MKKVIILFFILTGSLLANEEIDQGGNYDKTKPTYVLVLNQTEKCGKKKKDISVDCEVSLIHAKHTNKLHLIKFNKKNAKGDNQVTVNKFMKNPDRFMSYTTEYALSDLFPNISEFSSLMAQLTVQKKRKKILVRAQDSSGYKEAYIDIHEYTD